MCPYEFDIREWSLGPNLPVPSCETFGGWHWLNLGTTVGANRRGIVLPSGGRAPEANRVPDRTEGQQGGGQSVAQVVPGLLFRYDSRPHVGAHEFDVGDQLDRLSIIHSEVDLDPRRHPTLEVPKVSITLDEGQDAIVEEGIEHGQLRTLR